MKLDGIVKSALDGNAILFLGAGFSVGAKNISKRDYFIGTELCKELIEKGKIDIQGEEPKDLEDLGYISQRYLETGNTKRDMITLLKNNFSCFSVAEEHRIIADINWKKIYTTNYDDVMEVASREIGVLREPIVASTEIGEVYSQKNAVIHINGYVGSVNENNLFSTFKLTEQSYRTRTIPDSDWAIALHNDIKNAQSVIFIGYSLGYDLELQQIFSEDKDLKDKCLFVTFNPNKRAMATMRLFGEVYTGGLCEFCKIVSEISNSYDRSKVDYQLMCLVRKEIRKETVVTNNADEIIKLLVDGTVDEKLIMSSFDNKYVVKRDCIEKVVDFFAKEGKLVILHSDLANGKTIVMKELEAKLMERGTIYYLNRINSSLADDLEFISSLEGIHYIFCENYSQLLDCEEWTIIKKYRFSNIKYIFTSRSYINDNFYMRVVNDLQLDYNTMAMYDINFLSDLERYNFVQYLNEYNLWGTQSTQNAKKKDSFIRKVCNNEIKNILLEVYKSKHIIEKINDIIHIICQNSTCKDVLLMAFICNVMAIEMTYDDIETILGYRINDLYFQQYKEIKEFVLIEGSHLRFKSSSIAAHVIANNNFNEDILKLICKMVNVLSKHSYISQNVTILKLLISFSNLRMIFNRRDKNIKNIYIRFYENARKTQYYSKNQFFWIQYAIAVMEIDDYSAAEIYLENASAFSKELYSEESYQVESLRARLLLEKTLYCKDTKKAFDCFEKAHNLICSNKTPERHYPYRQASQYVDYYRVFYKSFSQEQKVAFMFMCVEMKKKMQEYLNNSNSYERNSQRKSNEIAAIMRKIENIVSKMASEE